MRGKTKKLALNKETTKTLSVEGLRKVAGGRTIEKGCARTGTYCTDCCGTGDPEYSFLC